jgi:hypothetical protein
MLLRRVFLLLAAVAAVAVLTPLSVSGATRAPANTFAGSCVLSGTVAFRPALTNTPTAVDQTAVAAGTCTGTFTGRNGQTEQLSAAPATYSATEQAPEASCAGGTDAGSGSLTISREKVEFAISEVRVGPAVAATANGASGGSAAGQGNVSPSTSPVAIAQACGGTGLAQAPIDIRLWTTPSMSG